MRWQQFLVAIATTIPMLEGLGFWSPQQYETQEQYIDTTNLHFIDLLLFNRSSRFSISTGVLAHHYQDHLDKSYAFVNIHSKTINKKTEAAKNSSSSPQHRSTLPSLFLQLSSPPRNLSLPSTTSTSIVL